MASICLGPNVLIAVSLQDINETFVLKATYLMLICQRFCLPRMVAIGQYDVDKPKSRSTSVCMYINVIWWNWKA